MSSPSHSIFIDDISSLRTLLSTLTGLNLKASSTTAPSLFIDLEGIRLSRHGTISLLTLFLLPTKTTYLLDITTLTTIAFSTPSPTHPSITLQTILQDPSIPKVFFDVRNDSDALFFHFQIALAGIVDLQLLELGSREGGIERKRTVCGLARCIKMDASLTWKEKNVWEAVKEKGTNLFAPEKGGRYEVFDARPLSEDMRAYCVQDVRFLPGLWEVYTRRLGGNKVWSAMIERETLERVKESQSVGYDPHSKSKALGPWV